MNPATYRNPSRICFDADQLQRHRRLSYMLQQADCLAGELLLMLRRFDCNPRHRRRARPGPARPGHHRDRRAKTRWCDIELGSPV